MELESAQIAVGVIVRQGVRIAELEAELAFVKDWLDIIEPVELVRCMKRWAEKKAER